MTYMAAEGRPSGYPRTALELILLNRATNAGFAGLSLPVFAGVPLLEKAQGTPAEFAVILGIALSTSAGIVLTGISHSGLGTVKAYRRTVDAYRKLGFPPVRYQGEFEGWYCQERGFQLAIKDISTGRIQDFDARMARKLNRRRA